MAYDFSATLQESFKYGSSALKTIPDGTRFSIPLLGYPLHFSLAPLVHNVMFEKKGLPWRYHLLESSDPNDLLDIFSSSRSSDEKTIAAAVTMPHKVNFMSLVDDIMPEAREIGAINTVFTRVDRQTGKNRLLGTNTDYIGIGQSFLTLPSFIEQHTAGKGRPAMVIGGGGAARSAIYALHHLLGVEEIYMVNRLESEINEIQTWFAGNKSQTSSKVNASGAKLRAILSLEEAKVLPTPFYVVSAVPDFPPQTDGEKTAHVVVQEFMTRSNSSEQGILLEMCYHPKVRTSLCEFAEKRGWKVIPGTVAMIWQGIAQHMLWTENEFQDVRKIAQQLGEIVEDEIVKRNSK